MKIMRSAIRTAVLAALVAGLQAQAQPQPPPPAPAESQAPAVSPAPAASPAVEEVISLYNAKFSEDFIKRKIKGDGTVYNLSVTDLLRLKEVGIPESLVDAMLATKKAQPAPAEGQVPGVAAPGSESPAAPLLAPGQSRPPKEWEGLVRKSSGAVLGIGSRWENGTLHLENEQFKWITSEGTDRNALIPVASLKEQFLVCEKKPQGDCFEWGIKTKDAEYRFRDILWKTGPTPKARAIYEYMKAAYPNLAAPTYPVDERK
jgi:hypothetical protein